MEHRFAVLRSIWKQLEDSMSGSGEPDSALVNELGPQALAAVRGLGDDLEVERFEHGEHYVLALKLRAAIPLESVRHARLIQILDRMEQLWESNTPRAKSLWVFAARLIYRLPVDSGIRPRTCAGIEELDRIRERIEQTFVDLFPGNHAVVELRDCDGATIRWGQVVGPAYEQVKQKEDERKLKAKQV